MTTRVAETVPVSTGFFPAVHQAGLKAIRYLALLHAAFVEAYAEARVAQARWRFISE
jgi:hypothetical protein